MNLKKCIHKSYISFASWNVHGLKNKDMSKANDPSFVREISKHDIIALQETHLTSDMHFYIPGYVIHQANRPIAGVKSHGGVAFLVKESLKPGIKFINAPRQTTSYGFV